MSKLRAAVGTRPLPWEEWTRLSEQATKDTLDDMEFMQYAGQCLAEEMARRLLGQPAEVTLDDGTNGNVRFARRAFEMIVVRDGKCEALVRR